MNEEVKTTPSPDDGPSSKQDEYAFTQEEIDHIKKWGPMPKEFFAWHRARDSYFLMDNYGLRESNVAYLLLSADYALQYELLRFSYVVCSTEEDQKLYDALLRIHDAMVEIVQEAITIAPHLDTVLGMDLAKKRK